MSSLLSSDIYRIREFMDGVQQSHIPNEDSNSLVLGMFGYLSSAFSIQLQNSIILSSEWMNEMFPIRARLEKNLLTHAMMANITDLNAIPSGMDVFVALREIDIYNNLVNDVLVLDKDTPIYLGNFEFHFEYDIKIFRQRTGDKDLYVAQYDLINNTNRLSSITNPYLLPPVRIKESGDNFIFIRAKIRQTEFANFNKKILSVDPIDNKSFEFTFENQLADFTVNITSSNGKSFDLTPLYDESPIITNDMYCYFSYVNANTVRVKFINSVYVPKMNDNITVKIVTTKGDRGNFTYKSDVIVKPTSSIYTYKDLLMLVRPITDAQFGENKKSIEDLKRIIPRELLSRGSITCTEDLNNFFNGLNNRYNKLKFVKKVDNQFNRTHSSFLLLKDTKDNIIPTNTVDMRVNLADFDTVGDRLIIRPGNPFEYNHATDRVHKINPSVLTTSKIKEKETNGFLYTSPFTVVVNKSPLITSHYLTIFDRKYDLIFKYINEQSFIQFISTKVSWKRDLVVDMDYYKMDMEFTQNIDEDYKLVTVDDSGMITDSKIKVVGIVYNDKDQPHRYIEASAIYFDESSKTYKFRFKFHTNDDITRDSMINITNMMDLGTTNTMYAYLNANGCKFMIYILADLGIEYGNKGNLPTLIPGLGNYTLCNTYEVDGGIDYFINFSEIISSIVKTDRDESGSEFHYLINNVPMVKYSYLSNSNQVRHLINYIIDKKIFIDSAIEILENSFNIDLKFFNTYGKSRINKIGHLDEPLDRVNIKLSFRIKFSSNNNNESFVNLIKLELKRYIEDINNDKNFHISSIILHLKNKFAFISYIEFLGINTYDPYYQSIITNVEKNIYTPEFINIGSTEIEYSPDIDIVVL